MVLGLFKRELCDCVLRPACVLTLTGTSGRFCSGEVQERQQTNTQAGG